MMVLTALTGKETWLRRRNHEKGHRQERWNFFV